MSFESELADGYILEDLYCCSKSKSNFLSLFKKSNDLSDKYKKLNTIYNLTP